MTYLVKLYTVLHTPPYHHYYHKCIDIHISYIVNNIIFEYAYLVPKCVWLYVFHWLQMWMELIDHRQWNIQQILWLIEQQQQNERKKKQNKMKIFWLFVSKNRKKWFNIQFHFQHNDNNNIDICCIRAWYSDKQILELV